MLLIETLRNRFPENRLRTSAADRYAWAADASFYLLVPQVVVFPESIEEIIFLFEVAKQFNTSVTFRAAGTSLSGQSVTDGILADISRYWGDIEVKENGALVKVQPGVTGQKVNHVLRRFGRKIGPDPASISAAMMGGILSNNSSGMCCGVAYNSYHTLEHIEFVLGNGMQFNTAEQEDYTRFESDAPGIFNGILELKTQLEKNTALTEKIRRKYRIKNTVGYGLNAFLDYRHPLDILAHLLIGAEGTLGFISSATLRTIPDKRFKLTGLLCFASAEAACNAIGALSHSGAAALEFMDRAAVRAIELFPDAPEFLRTLPGDAACLLCEYQSKQVEHLETIREQADQCFASLPIISQTPLTQDTQLQARYWKLRKGLYPSVAAVRASGSSVMLEDVAFPVHRLGEAITSLQQLFRRHGYHNAIVFGHAKDGNLHFLISQAVNTKQEIGQFERFNDDLATLVVQGFDGSLKAEHGTGRQIAPYVETEWGSEAYAVMKELKQLVDANNILNAGVMITDNAQCHVQNLKSLPVVEPEVDKCVECGYCEHRCPSKDFTLSPRQRISLRRSLVRLREAGEHQTCNSILKDYQFKALDTCAVDGLCATDCPVSINTGELVKKLRRENHSRSANSIALLLAKQFRITESIIRTALRAGHLANRLLGKKFMFRLTSATRKIVPGLPLWPLQLAAPLRLRQSAAQDPALIYFTACVNRMMGSDPTRKESQLDVFLKLAARAGIQIQVANNKGSCCGQLFASKGFTTAQQYTVNKTIDALWTWSREGRIPVMTDFSSCSYSLQQCRPYLTTANQQKFDQLRILDSIEFAHDQLMPLLKPVTKKKRVVLHPVCSVHKMGLLEKLQALGQSAASEVVVPFHAGCCGMAGDRGFYYPGLIRAATKKELAEAGELQADGFYSSAKTCEMALSEFNKNQYRSIFYLLDEVSADQSL